MSESLDRFVRDAMRAHDGHDEAGKATAATGAPGTGAAVMLGALPGHAVESFIACGGMGAVYRARQVALEREVAVKVMTAEAESPEMAERFRREALVLGRLEHPNIVPIHELGTDDEGQLYYTMKLVKGRTLQHLLNGLRDRDTETLRQHSLASLLTIFRKVCDALAFAHSQGVLHRDLKPENVMVGEFGEVLVMDWGLAKMTNDGMTSDEPAGMAPTSAFGMHHSLLTLQGSVMGTPQYMSPEQARGEVDGLDARSDIFSLGGVLYAILTLRPPVEGTTLDEVLEKVRTGSITPPTAYGATTANHGKPREKGNVLEARKITPLPHIAGGKVPAALSAVVMKALQLDKNRRYGDVASLSADIEAYQGGFATKAEQAGALKQLKLLMLRHKAVTASLAALVLISIGFVIKVMASERKATRNAVIAKANEKRANDHAEESRRSLARAQIALADAAALNLDAAAMREALDACPGELRDDTWRYLAARLDSSFHTLDKRHGQIFRAVFRPTAGDGEFWLLPEDRKAVHVFDPMRGEVTRTLEGMPNGRRAGGMSLDGREIVIAGGNPLDVRVLDTATGEERFRFQEEGAGEIVDVFFSADATRVNVLWKGPRGNSLRSIERSTRAVRWKKDVQRALCSPDRRRVAVVSRNSIQIIREETGELIVAAEPNQPFLWDICFSQDSRLVAASDHSGFASVWETETGRLRQRFRVTNGRLTGVTFTVDGRLITMGQLTADITSQRVIQVWNLELLVPVVTLLDVPSKGYNFTVDPLHGWVCAPGVPTKFWRVPLHQNPVRIQARRSCECVHFFGSNHLITAGSSDSAVSFWDLRTQPPRNAGITPRNTNSGTVTRARDVGLFTNFPLRSVLRASRGPDGEPRMDPPPWKIPGGQSIATNAAGNEVLVGDNRNLMHYVPGKQEAARQWSMDGVERWRAVSFADGDRKFVSIGSTERTGLEQKDVLAIWDRDTGTLLHRIDHPSLLNALAVSPDGGTIACAGMDKSVHFFSAQDGRRLKSMRAHDRAVTAIAWHPTRPILATVSDDVSLKLWDSRDGRLLGQGLGIGRAILSVNFDVTGDRIAIGTADDHALIFETEKLLDARLSDTPRASSITK